MVVVIILNQWTPSFVCRPKGQILTEGQARTCFALMRYLEKQVHMETLHMPSVQIWLGNELESRGIDSMVYSRHIIQLLQQDDEEEIDCPDYFDFNKYKPRVNKKGKVKKPEKVNQANLEKTEDRKKSAAIECLQAAVSEEDTGIEILVEELCTKLKEVCKPANLEDPEVLQLSDSSASTDETDTSNSSPELSGDPAERYYAAFPALHGQEKSECGDFSSLYHQDSVDVWKKNPITMSSSEGFIGNFDSGNESEKDSKHRAGRDKGSKKRSENKSNKGSRKKKSTRNQGRTTGKNNDSMGKFCRFASWPQDWNYASDSAVDYHKECTIDKERELCSQVESLLKEILLPHAKYDTHHLFASKVNKPCYRTAPASLSEDRFSLELQEKDFWYTQPFDDLFEAEESSTPFHQRLYKRHSYPSFECFIQSDDQDILCTTSSRSEKCEMNDDTDQHLGDGKGNVVKDTTDLQTLVMKDDETLGLQLLSLEETNDGKLDSIDRDMFGLQDLNLNAKVSQHNASLDNDDSFGLQTLMVEKEYFENLLEDNLPEKDILVMPIQELVPDTLSHPNHSSYFLSSSPWTATENDFREVVMPQRDGTGQARFEDGSNYTSPVQNVNTGYKTRQNQEIGDVVSDEYQDYKFVNSYDYYRGDNLPFTDSSSSVFDSVLKSNRDSTTSSNSSTSMTTMTDHGPDTEWTLPDSEEKTAVPDYDLFTHPLSSLYASFHTTDFLSPASNTIDHEISIPVDSNETTQANNLSNIFLFGRDVDVWNGSALNWDMRSSSQLAFGGKASQLWDVNYQGKKMLGFTYPWKPLQHLDHIQETSTDPNMQSVNLTGNNPSDDEASLNTLIPQITFSLICEEEESAFMNDDSDEENVDHYLFSRDCRKDFDRSYSLNELSSLRSKTESIGITSNSQLSKSFELVPSEHSAFQDVIPKRIQHAVSEPNLQQYHLDSNQNEPKFLNECLPHTPKKAVDSTSPKEHLFFSPKTHFQPIQTPVGKNNDTIPDASSSDYHLRDLFGGCPKTSKTPYQKFQDARSDSSEESFIPMFKLRKEHDKYIQTNTSITNQTEEPNYDSEEYVNICNRCGNIIQVRNWEHEEDNNECICMEFYQNALEDFDIYGYVDSLTVSEQNTPQNVPKDMKNACTDSGYEDFDTGETGFEGSRNARYTFPGGHVPPVASIPADNAFECITVEKSSGEKQVLNREDGWVMYKVEGGLGLQCLNEAHIRKNLKYAKAGKEEDDVEEDEVDDGEEFLMHQVEEEWLLNGYYCEGELSDDTNYFEYPVSQSVWSTGQDTKTREEQIFIDQQFSEREAYIEPCMRKLSLSSYSIDPHASENSICTRDFVQEVLQPRDRECIQKDSSKLDENKENMSNFWRAERFHPTENMDMTYGAAIEERPGAPQHESNQQDEDVIKVKLVFHQRGNAHVNFGNKDMYSNTELQENIDAQIFMPMPSQAVFSTDLEEEWLKGKHNEKDLTSQSSLKGAGGKKKPCSFFMEGICRRMDCKFAHDVSNITCRFWEEGDCFKAEMCPFLHGYYPKVKGEASGRKPKGSKFEFRADDFPDLRKVLKDGDCKSKTTHAKKVAYFDAKASNKNSKRAQTRSAEKGKATMQKLQCEGKTHSQTNIKCSAFPSKTTSSSAPKNKQ